MLEAGFVYCFFSAPLSAFGTAPRRKLRLDHKRALSQPASRGQPGFGRGLRHATLRGAEPRQNEGDAAHNKQLCKQVPLKQPYRPDATLCNIVTNASLPAVSCLSPPRKPCRHRRRASCQPLSGALAASSLGVRASAGGGERGIAASAALSRGAILL